MISLPRLNRSQGSVEYIWTICVQLLSVENIPTDLQNMLHVPSITMTSNFVDNALIVNHEQLGHNSNNLYPSVIG